MWTQMNHEGTQVYHQGTQVYQGFVKHIPFGKPGGNPGNKGNPGGNPGNKGNP